MSGDCDEYYAYEPASGNYSSSTVFAQMKARAVKCDGGETTIEPVSTSYVSASAVTTPRPASRPASSSFSMLYTPTPFEGFTSSSVSHTSTTVTSASAAPAGYTSSPRFGSSSTSASTLNSSMAVTGGTSDQLTSSASAPYSTPSSPLAISLLTNSPSTGLLSAISPLTSLATLPASSASIFGGFPVISSATSSTSACSSATENLAAAPSNSIQIFSTGQSALTG